MRSEVRDFINKNVIKDDYTEDDAWLDKNDEELDQLDDIEKLLSKWYQEIVVVAKKEFKEKVDKLIEKNYEKFVTLDLDEEIDFYLENLTY
jgi:hypothetical protein